MNVAPQSARHLARARFFDFAGADFAISAADAVDSSHHQHRNVQYSGVVLLAPNVSYWLQGDIQRPEIDFRLSPNFGHSEAHAGLPRLTRSGLQAIWRHVGLDHAA